MSKSTIYKAANSDEQEKALNFLMKRYRDVGYIKSAEFKYNDEYIKNSIYFIATEGGDIVGVIRLVKNTPMGLPVLNNYKIYPIYNKLLNPKTSVMEIGNLAAIPNKNIAKGLYRLAIEYALNNHCKYLVAGIDKGLYNKLLITYPVAKIFFKDISKSKIYIGSETVPIVFKPNPIMLLFL